MQITAQQMFKDLEAGHYKPFYLIVGEEPFQAGEILSRLKSHFLKTEDDLSFNFEMWDGEHLDAGSLLSSLDTLPGLFSGPGDSIRLVVCKHFEKVQAHGLEILDGYLKQPSESTCFVVFANKVDKRKAWVKAMDEKGVVIEVNEPYDREWPKWHGYFEKKVGKKIASDAWEYLVGASGRSLSLLWTELQKTAIFVGEREIITSTDVTSLTSSSGGGDVFSLADEVLSHHYVKALCTFQDLLRNGESEVKILSILVRQFRICERYLALKQKGITDTKVIGQQIGVHPYFVSKVAQQAKAQDAKRLSYSLRLLAECDYRLKTGEGGVFENFFVPYFASAIQSH